MKKYVILTPQVGNMGGGQMFVCNKAEYMANLGWDVTICYFTESPVLIKKMLDFKRIYVPKFSWGIQYYTPSQVKDTINHIAAQISSDLQDEIVIESHLCYLALWAELLAEQLHAKHIVNSFEEDIPIFSSNALDFFEYKLKRWQCVNASENSLKRLFKQNFKEEYNQFNHTTYFYCSNVSVDSSNITDLQLPDSSSFNIISIGRLNKPYISVMLSELYEFAIHNKSVNIGLIFVGGSPDGSVENYIKKKFGTLNNVKIFLLGYLFPIPLNVIKSADIAISTSNSVLVTHDQGVPTITVDANDNFAIGVYGINTNRNVFRKDEPQVPIREYIEKLYKREILNTTLSPNQIINENHLLEQVKFLSKSEYDCQYYDVYGIYSFFDISIGIAKRCLACFLRKN